MTRFLLSLCLLLCAHSLWAQTESQNFFPRWYAGLQYGRQDYQLFLPRNPELGRTNARRPQLTLGYQFRPKLAVQVGIAPIKAAFSYEGSGTNQAGEPLSEAGSSKGRSLAVPIVVRYTLAVKPWRNLHVDALAGGVLFWSRSQTEFARTENGVITSSYQSTDKLMNAYAALGPSVRYGFGRHVEVFSDWMFYKNLRSASASNQAVSTGNKAGITNSLNLGVRYRFGYK